MGEKLCAQASMPGGLFRQPFAREHTIRRGKIYVLENG